MMGPSEGDGSEGKNNTTTRIINSAAKAGKTSNTMTTSNCHLPSSSSIETRNLQSDDDDGGDHCCASCDSASSSPASDSATSDRTLSIRILTWSGAEPDLRAYADLYEASNPDGPKVHIYVVPSLKILNTEATYDLRLKSGLYDGFVVPPLLMGDLYEQNGGLAAWDDDATSGLGGDATSTFHDLLPYYKYSVATYDRNVRCLPLFAGSQQLLLFRKDYLDSMNLPTPKTWSDWVRVASKLQDAPIGPNGTTIYGGCMGRLSQEGCRKKDDLSSYNDGDEATATCNSQSMSYIGMMLSSMTQPGGNSTGWMLGLDATSPSGLQPLFVPTIERILLLMEQQLRYGAPNELFEDARLNLRLFEQGLCAMTVTSDHPTALLSQRNVGFVPLPGSHQVLDRSSEELTNCSPSVCPYGSDFEEWGRINAVPFASTDAPVGSVSAFVSQARQDAAKQFFGFVMASSTSPGSNVSNSATTREQPMTFSQLNNSTIRGYEAIITSTTSSVNGAIPFRTPNAFNLFSELDNKVYDYLVAGNYTEANRQRVAQSVQTSWQYMIRMHDSQGQADIPTSIFYELSLGTYVTETSEDWYIGEAARITGWSLAGLSCLSSFLLAVWVWKYQNETVVRGTFYVFESLFVIIIEQYTLNSCLTLLPTSEIIEFIP
jgi:ABC-type glycerol-3-phosphate transport system substrate-binding protein